MGNKCSVPGCNIKYHARGLCRLHYMRKWHTGEIFADIPPKRKKDITGLRFGKLFVISCSHVDSHKQTYWNCICDCGTEKKIRGSSLWNGRTDSCGCLTSSKLKARIREKSSNWKGGKRLNNGYVLVKQSGHPNADQCGYVLEHRLVMSQHLGRPLLDSEIVHHKNQIRTDNRIENLEIVQSTNHRGIVVCPHCGEEFAIQ